MFAQVFNADGSRRGEEFLVNDHVTNNQYAKSLVATEGGGFAVLYEGYDAAGEYPVRLQQFDAQGARIDDPVQLHEHTAGHQYDAAAARYAADDGDDDARFAELPRIAKDVPRTFGGVDAPCAAAARAQASPAMPGWALRLIGMSAQPVEEDESGDKELYDRRRAERLARLLNIGNEHLPYAQGMNFVAASILSECERGGGADEALAFGLYCYALRDLGCEKLYGRRLPAALAALDLSLRRHAPALHAHLAGCGFDPQLYAVEWLSALFVVSVPRTLSLAVLDLLFAGVEDAPIRVAVAILRQAEKPLLRLKTLDDLVAGFKPAVRAVRPKLVLIDVLRVSNRVPLLASPASPKSARSNAVDTPFGEGVVTGVAAQGRVAVALTWGGRAALERRLVTSAPPPPPPEDASPSIPTARWTGSSPDVTWFRARADFADY